MRLFPAMLSTVALACGFMLAAPAPSIATDVAPVPTLPFIPLSLSTPARSATQFQAKKPGCPTATNAPPLLKPGVRAEPLASLMATSIGPWWKPVKTPSIVAA
jgi:hypothetical protein